MRQAFADEVFPLALQRLAAPRPIARVVAIILAALALVFFNDGINIRRDDHGILDASLLVYWYSTEAESYPRTSQVRLKMRQAQIRDLKVIAKGWIGMGDGRRVEASYAKRQTYCYRFDTRANYEDSKASLARLEGFIREFVANSGQFR